MVPGAGLLKLLATGIYYTCWPPRIRTTFPCLRILSSSEPWWEPDGLRRASENSLPSFSGCQGTGSGPVRPSPPGLGSGSKESIPVQCRGSNSNMRQLSGERGGGGASSSSALSSGKYEKGVRAVELPSSPRDEVMIVCGLL